MAREATRRKSQPDVVTPDTENDRRLRFALQAASMYIWERDMDSTEVLRFGDAAAVLGAEIETIEHFIAHVHAEDRQRVRTAIEGVIHRCESYEIEFRFVGVDGRERWVRDVGRRVVTGGDDRFVGVCMDVSAEVEARQAAARMAFEDRLTGLANRQRLELELADAAAGFEPGDEAQAAVIAIDLDGFKLINDTHGHAAGDDLLVEVAELLRTICRPGDMVARVAGDEFVLLLSPGDVEATERVARALLGRAQSPFRAGGHDVYVGFTLGAAIGPGDGRTGEALMRAADVALHRAKADQRGALCYFEPGMNAQSQRRQLLEHELRTALQRGQVSLVYQPLIDLDGDRTTGVEALMRWTHPEHGAVSPGEFIPVAESSGLILQLGEWALRTAARAAIGWPGVRMSVNVSAVQFRHRSFIPMLVNVLAETGLAPDRLELEITEGVLLYETDEAVATMSRVKALGVLIAMDDFGTGYSSLSYISRFAFDKIKIDGSFVRSLFAAKESAAIIRAVLNLGRSLGVKTNAEGVETAEQLAFLRAEGCDQVQGFLLGRPMTPAAMAERLQAEATAALSLA